MSTFGENFRASAWPVLADHQESVIYRPLNGRPRSIKAIVERTPPEPVGDFEQSIAPRVMLTVQNDRVDGIGSSEVNTGGDIIDVAWRTGDTPSQRAIVTAVETPSGAMLEVTVR